MPETKTILEQDYAAAIADSGGWYSKTLFHELAWLDYLRKTVKGAPCVIGGGGPSGGSQAWYHVFLEVRLGPFRVMGSPLPGWTTNYMGPLFREGADQRALIGSIKRHARKHGFLYIELKNRALDPASMEMEGFDQRNDVTTVVPLSQDPDRMWRRLKGNARNRIRKAEAAGLLCAETDDPSMLDEYYAMIVRRYAAQKLSFPFGVERLRTLWDCLKPHGRLITLRVVKEGETIAAGLFPHDERTIYYFGGASKAEHNSLCPNELMHWTVMQKAAALGVAEYDLCGTSRFKRKFGSEDIPFVSWSYSPIPGLIHFRNLLLKLHWKSLAWRHRVRGWVRGGGTRLENPEAAEE